MGVAFLGHDSGGGGFSTDEHDFAFHIAIAVRRPHAKKAVVGSVVDEDPLARSLFPLPKAKAICSTVA
jgi:hypothetical protein